MAQQAMLAELGRPAVERGWGVERLSNLLALFGIGRERS